MRYILCCYSVFAGLIMACMTAPLLPANAADTAPIFQDYLDKLSQHPQVESILSTGQSYRSQARGELGLPDPVFAIGVDNVPTSNPEFDRFLPSAKTIGVSQSIPNPVARRAKSDRFEQMSAKQILMADYTKSQLRYILTSKLAEYKSITRQKELAEKQLSHYRELENTFKGQIESGQPVFQRFSEVDVERAEAEFALNDLAAAMVAIEADFIALIGEIPDIAVLDVPALSSGGQDDPDWAQDPSLLYPVRIAAEDVRIAQKDVDIADAAFLPNFGVNAVYKQREAVESGLFDGDDWFSLQAQISIPLWASRNQTPKLNAAKQRQQSAQYAHDDAIRNWIKQMTILASSRDAAAKNMKILQEKDKAMGKKIAAAQRNYESGSDNLDAVLWAKIDRLNIQMRLADIEQKYISRAAEYQAHIIQDLKGVK